MSPRNRSGKRCSGDPQAQLVDVRTDAEWNFVGLPDLAEAGKQPVLIPWQVFPTMQVNGGFVDQLRQAGLTAGAPHLLPLPQRRAQPAPPPRPRRRPASRTSFNVADGFEGPAGRARAIAARVAGWKADGLPWRQR